MAASRDFLGEWTTAPEELISASIALLPMQSHAFHSAKELCKNRGEGPESMAEENMNLTIIIPVFSFGIEPESTAKGAKLKVPI
jgi:hypothetical protein